jgi:hypothetical protein
VSGERRSGARGQERGAQQGQPAPAGAPCSRGPRLALNAPCTHPCRPASPVAAWIVGFFSVLGEIGSTAGVTYTTGAAAKRFSVQGICFL